MLQSKLKINVTAEESMVVLNNIVIIIIMDITFVLGKKHLMNKHEKIVI